MHQTLLARFHAQNHIASIAANNLHISTRRTGHDTTGTDLHLDIMDNGAHRYIRQRHGITRLNIDLIASHHLIASSKTLRRKDIGLLAIGIGQQRDKRRAVRIIFQPLDLGRHIELAPTEVDNTVGLLVATATKPHRDAPGIITPATFRLALGQLLQRLALVELAAINNHQLA